MTTVQLISPPQAQRIARSGGDAGESVRASRRKSPATDELVDDVLPTTDTVVVAGPPVLVIAGFGWVVMLMVCAPLTILLTIVALGLVAVAAVVAVGSAVLLGPYLLVRHLTSTLRRSG